MSASNKLAQKLSITATAWPKDPFRPNMQLANFMQSLATHPNLTPNAVEAAVALQRNAIMQKVRFTTSHHSRVTYHFFSIHYHQRCCSQLHNPNITPVSWKRTKRVRRALAAHGGRCSLGYGSRIPMRLRISLLCDQ